MDPHQDVKSSWYKDKLSYNDTQRRVGISLKFCKQIVRELGGELNVQNDFIGKEIEYHITFNTSGQFIKSKNYHA